MKNTQDNFFRKDPYSYLFQLGILSAGLGVLLWLAFDLQYLDFYPRSAHARLMFFGFLWSFIAGFLMTAIPKMTQTQVATWPEVSFAIGFVFLQWGANLLNKTQLSVLLFAFQTVLLMFFVLRRFLNKKQLPFEGFIFLPIAFAVLSVGIVSYWFSTTGDYQLLFLLSGQGFVLNLICGIGGRLIPVLSRVPASLSPDEKGQSAKMTEMLILAIALNSSFLLEAFQWNLTGWFVRAILLAVIAVHNFKIFKKPSSYSFVGWGLRTAVVLMIGGYFILSLGWSANPLALMHVIFIGGFGLVTLMVATRVTLAHGGESTDIELRSKAVFAVIILFLIAGVTRYLSGSISTGVLFYTAMCAFLFGLFFWLFRFYKVLRN